MDKAQAYRTPQRLRNARDPLPRSTVQGIVMVGDRNAGLLAEAAVTGSGSQDAFQCIYGPNAKVEDAVSYATENEEKAHLSNGSTSCMLHMRLKEKPRK